MTTLVPGGNAPVAAGQLRVNISYTPIPDAEIDISAFVLTSAGKVRDDGDMCFYGQTCVLGGSVRLTATSAGRAEFTVDLSRIDRTVEKVALAATIYENKATFGRVSTLAVAITGGIDAQIPTHGMNETALILGEFYRRQDAWKFRCVAQGFAGGLEPLAKHLGVAVAAPLGSPAQSPSAPTPAPAPTTVPPAAPKSTISLSKVTLDKSRSSISLEKTSAGFGEIKVNLNWNQGGSGLLGGLLGKRNAIDLDLGCLFEMQDGLKGAVQALGKRFGDLREEPYIQLMGDDRTGSVAGGEWLHINGQQWSEIKRILVFAFIYHGAPNWKATDGVVTIFVPGQPEIEVRMNEEGGRHGMCAIALLENVNGAVKVSRRVDFHPGHEELDRAYGWGMRWKAGSK
ncbi:tellurium resistance protein TerA [Burkholderia stabilis]|uniref:Tellurium resistance protein TerA n=1 Tax=Burkholderia stabilis TaxID=95485 RepID=A0A4Q2A5W8_9BURK|nr:TerD family protein [Burkholderia stabilis]RXV64557.1 tellurium resistance protein TerA [Burkholderia stabilis]